MVQIFKPRVQLSILVQFWIKIFHAMILQGLLLQSQMPGSSTYIERVNMWIFALGKLWSCPWYNVILTMFVLSGNLVYSVLEN